MPTRNAQFLQELQRRSGPGMTSVLLDVTTKSRPFEWGVPVGIGYGVDVGHAIRLTFENGSDDYLGAPVNIAAKMQDLARPNGGGVVQTEVWSRLLKPHLRDKFPNEGVMKIGDRSVAVRMTAEVEYKNHRSKKLRSSPAAR